MEKSIKDLVTELRQSISNYRPRTIEESCKPVLENYQAALVEAVLNPTAEFHFRDSIVVPKEYGYHEIESYLLPLLGVQKEEVQFYFDESDMFNCIIHIKE